MYSGRMYILYRMYTYVCIPYRSKKLRTEQAEIGSHLFFLISSQKQYQSGEGSKEDVKKI